MPKKIIIRKNRIYCRKVQHSCDTPCGREGERFVGNIRLTEVDKNVKAGYRYL